VLGPYRTERLQLRELRSSEGAEVAALLGDLRVVQHTMFPVHTREQAADFIERTRTARKTEPITRLGCGISPRGADGTLIGLCGLEINPRLQAGEIWYLFAVDSWGKGLATEVARGLVNIGFGDFDLHRVWATCLPENPASARVLEKTGFRKEGHQRQNLPIQGQWRDSYLFALLKDEWAH